MVEEKESVNGEAASGAESEPGCNYMPEKKTKHRGEALGELSSKWALFLKIFMVGWTVFATGMTLICIPWIKWQTDEAYTNIAHRENSKDVVTLIKDMNESVMRSVDRIQSKHDLDVQQLIDRLQTLPPADWRRRIETLEGAVKVNTDRLTQILVNQEKIKTKLGIDAGGAVQ